MACPRSMFTSRRKVQNQAAEPRSTTGRRPSRALISPRRLCTENVAVEPVQSCCLHGVIGRIVVLWRLDQIKMAKLVLASHHQSELTHVTVLNHFRCNVANGNPYSGLL